MQYKNYFEFRQITPAAYSNYKIPAYLLRIISAIPNARILDIGCGFGQLLLAMKLAGISNAEGLDIEPEAIEYCRARGLRCTDAAANPGFFKERGACFDLVVMSHVLEHFPKDQTISELRKIKEVLKAGGGLIIMVPNAQSNTGAYWAYEDFTHHQLFTSGSLYYVLRAAGFESIEFLDIDCTEGLAAWKRFTRKFFLRLYAANYRFWNTMTMSAFHGASPSIFSYEIKALARLE